MDKTLTIRATGCQGIRVNVMPLPSFEQPPVAEVVLGVSFNPIPGLGLPQQFDLWSSEYQADYPQVLERPRYEPPLELVDRPFTGPSVRFDLLNEAPTPGLWCVSQDKTSVLQLQRDWFAHNWRKVGPDVEYGRYPAGRAEFESRLTRLRDFVIAKNLGDIEARQCEITYLNEIDLPEEVSPDRFSQITRLVGSGVGAYLTGFESLQFSATALIPPKGVAAGRLHIEGRQGRKASDQQRLIYRLTLTARGKPADPSISGVLKFLDMGREAIVRSFADITTDDLHRRWGRQQ